MKLPQYLMTLLFSGIVFSTNAQSTSLQPKAPLVFAPAAVASPASAFNPIPSVVQQGMTNILFYEDFANGFAGNNGIGAWTAEDTGGGLIWQAVDAAGNGYYANGVASGVHPPAGEFSTNIGTLNSTTSANGWMAFDCDYYNTPVSEGYENTEGWITSPSLDFGNVGSVSVAWEQYFRYCCYPFAPIYLQVSSDGGANWTTFDAHGTFIESANTASANPLPTSVDISCAAAYQSNVLIRFSYLQAPETGDAYSHYYWGIDDVTIYENTTTNDLEAVQLTNGDVFNVYEYRITPMEQVIPVSEGGLIAGLMYRNNGVQDEDAVVLVEVLNSDGAVIHTVQEGIGTVSAPANAAVCPNPLQDTVYVQTGWAPELSGTYTLRATISPTTGSDFTPENNIISKTIVFTDYEMGHDDEEVLDYEFTPQESDIDGLFDPCGVGSFFHMHNEGSVAYGVAVRFGPNSGGGNLEFETRLYMFDGSVGLTDSPFETTYWEYNDAWTPDSSGNGEFVYLPFDDPIELSNDNFYFASVINEFESEAQLTVMGNANSNTDNSTGDFGRSGSGDFFWFTSQSATPAIRLVFSPEPFTYPGCTDSAACNYDQDAQEDDGSCEYESCVGCMDVEACNYDANAAIPDSSLCQYPELNYDCEGYCIDPTACNYIEMPAQDGAVLYEQTFEEFAPGYYISSNVAWTTWSGGSGTGTDEDAQVTDALANNGNNSLHIYAQSPSGGPMDVALLAGLDTGSYKMSMWMFVSSGNAAYYNFQEDLALGVGWAFEVTFDSNGDLSIVMDGNVVGSGTYPFDEWFEIEHFMDLDEDTIEIVVADQYAGGFTFDSSWGAVNFYAYGDGLSMANYFIDDILVEEVSALAVPEDCTYPGCQDPLASNYDATAGCEGECIYLTFDCASIGEPAWSGELMGLYPNWQEAMHGVAWEGEWVFNVPATMIEPGSGVSYGVHHVDWLGMEGMPDWATATSFDVGAAMGGSTQHCIAAVGTPTATGMHEITATGEVFISIFGQPFSIGEQSFSAILEVMANPNPIPGCTYALANNYVTYATLDDGSCEYLGCTDAEAANFNPFANVDDGSCGEACDPAGDSTCQADNDGDGVVSVSDLLILLGEFGGACE